jgi:uncharacterized protein YndB with AHSA1/START domain
VAGVSITVVDAGAHKVSRAASVGAPAGELFDLLADPYRHAELDGSGTVVDTVRGPHRLAPGETFSVKMKMYGLPYRITSRVTAFEEGRLIEWRHPLGHRWRWELEPESEGATLVTETFDYSSTDLVRARALELFGMPKQNAAGIEATLTNLQARYSR